ncbi:hypothetical protein Y1Q_0004927 [Alligator mississippiensis]|uniref:Uncharacterized protein n=1 Tax=Alligator mississippiensis TaxID=8496 RepID=A0A151MYH4_ALLMI|nr:hypothetical protein Y1Q_0004927 [Alligator mississippiensis]
MLLGTCLQTSLLTPNRRCPALMMHAVLKSAGDGLVASTPPELQPVGSDPIEGTAAGVKMGAGKGPGCPLPPSTQPMRICDAWPGCQIGTGSWIQPVDTLGTARPACQAQGLSVAAAGHSKARHRAPVWGRS